MAQTSTNLSGRYTIKNGSSVWHELHSSTPGYAGIHTEGTLYFTRNNGEATVYVSGTPINTLVGQSPYYNYDIEFCLLRNVSDIRNTQNSIDKVNQYAAAYSEVPGTYKNLGRPGNNPSVNGMSFQSTVDEIIYVGYRCGQSGGCSVGYAGTSRNPHSDWILVGSINTANIPYYTAPDYDINSISPVIGIHNSTSFNVNYKINGGTNGLDWVRLKIYNTSNTLLQEVVCGSGKGTSLNQSFTLNNNFTDGTQYKISVRFSDNHAEYETRQLNFYTYRTPKISSFNLSHVNFSGTGNTTLNWQTNGRKWNDDSREKNFITYIKFNTDNVWFQSSNNNPGQSDNNALVYQEMTLNKTIINNHFSIEQRSQDKIDTIISIKRNNPSSRVDSSILSKNISVQFTPKYRPDNDTNINNPPASLVYKKNNSSGEVIGSSSTLYVGDVPNIYVQWTYPSKADRGVVDGYIIRIYEDKEKTKLFNTVQVNTTNLTSSKIFNSRTDLKRGILNYISITAFYNKPDGSGKAEGPALDYPFVLPLGKLHKPVISYPVNNTKWHNTKFRILFELPEDDDMDSYDETTINNYIYKNIEVKINDSFVFAFKANTEDMTTNAIIYDKAFSIKTLGYKNRICINPSLVPNFPISSSYTIAVRVQKNYHKPIWSEWSNSNNSGTVKITQSAIDINMNPGDLVLANHFNKMRNWSIQLYNVYPIKELDSKNKQVLKYDIIFKDIYEVIYNTILNIQSGVNTWALFDNDRNNVKFNQTIFELSNANSVKQEIITALSNPQDKEGRNYIKILVNCMNKLY